MLTNIFKSAFDDKTQIKKMVKSDKEKKKMNTLMGGILELVGLFMEDHHELINLLD